MKKKKRKKEKEKKNIIQLKKLSCRKLFYLFSSVKFKLE